MKQVIKQTSWILVLTGLLAACVTINIYFPAAAADKAADKIIDDVWQLKNGEKPKDGAPAEPMPAPEAK